MSSLPPVDYVSQIQQNLDMVSQDEKTGKTIAQKVSNLEQDLIERYTELGSATPEKAASIQAEIKKLEIQYQRATTSLQSFMQLMKSKFDMMREAIRNLSVR